MKCHARQHLTLKNKMVSKFLDLNSHHCRMAGVSLARNCGGTKRVLGSKSGLSGRRPLASLLSFTKGRKLWVWEPAANTPSGSSLGVASSSWLDLVELALPGVNSFATGLGVMVARVLDDDDDGVIMGSLAFLPAVDGVSSNL